MKALVYEGPRIMNIREQLKPEPGHDEVIIRVERVGICGSELGGYLGHNSLRKPPLVMGHEFSGTIDQVGDAVKSFAAGDRVTANPLISCGHCRDCTTGAAQLCAQRKLIGAHLPGAFAAYVVVPERNVHALGSHVTFDEGAYTEPFACAVHICNQLQARPTDSLLIMGAGPIGLLTLQAARIYGLEDVTVVDLNEERLEIARALHGVTATSLKALGIAEGAKPFDAAVDAVGAQITRTISVNAVRPGGTVIFSGLHEAGSELPINDMIRNEIRTVGSFAYSPEDFKTALQWISKGKVRLSPWTETASLEQGAACFEKLIAAPGKTAKILLTVD
jgi:threonine dehydrogenase-like Zn-dependent dehydrogenase